MRQVIAIAAIGMLVLAGATEASATALTKPAAKRALARELRDRYEISYPTISCQKLTAKKMDCRFEGLTRADVREGNIAGHSGDAYVTKFRYGIDVRITSYRYG